MSLKKVLLLSAGGAIGLALLYLGFHEVNSYMDSSEFCNQCHGSMGPEFITHDASPHSTVGCAECHVGVGTRNMVKAKLEGLHDVIATITNNYERPIPTPIRTRRPARETCETCHWPERFTGDLVRVRTHYQPDEDNTKRVITQVLKVGGGQADIAKGIHWHVAARVWFLATDEKLVNIAWVGAEKDGQLVEYADPTRPPPDPAQIQEEKRLMDCVDCHNRVTHLFRSPDEMVDEAIANNAIDPGLPFIKSEAVSALSVPRSSVEEGVSNVEAVADFYRRSYPQVLSQKLNDVNRSIEELKKIVRLTTFPEMKVDWTTHLDQSGHVKPPPDASENWTPLLDDPEGPGCFRCHGKLVPLAAPGDRAVSNGVEPEAISAVLDRINRGAVKPVSNGGQTEPLKAECNLCHYNFEAEPSQLVPATPHPVDRLEDCLACHDRTAPKPIPQEHPWSTNEVCSACHQSEPVKAVSLRTPPSDVKPIPQVPHTRNKLEDCLACHDESAPEPVSREHPWSTNETCIACHESGLITVSVKRPVPPPDIPPVPHVQEDLEDCLLCHGGSSPRPFSGDHPWSTNETCSACHPAAPEPLALPLARPPRTPEIAHTTRGLEDCLLCHGGQSSSPQPLPAKHPWSTNETCSACHEATGTPLPLPRSPRPLASQIPHTLAGLNDCLQCHGQGAKLPAPPDHLERTSELCTSCHEPSPVSPPPPPAVIMAPKVPHIVAGLADCLQCHNQSSPMPLPADHAGRTSDLCLLCHEPAPVAPPPPPPPPPPAPAMPHPVAGQENCLLCHGSSGPIPFPSDHNGRGNDLCLFCHRPQ
ncbi:MAG: NapC/NirT family cytochrome c [Chloroflexi bacterium]|nr:NapC/NirT family cytochrome c [Chloroflexota bacterium]